MKLGRIVRTMAQRTFADKFQCIFNMLHSDRALPEPFVRYVAATGERLPSVILYRERQIHELNAFRFNGSRGSVLLFDKTFNLGAIYVTVAVLLYVTSDYIFFPNSNTRISQIRH